MIEEDQLQDDSIGSPPSLSPEDVVEEEEIFGYPPTLDVKDVEMNILVVTINAHKLGGVKISKSHAHSR